MSRRLAGRMDGIASSTLDKPRSHRSDGVENLAVGLGDPNFDKSKHTRPAPVERLSLKEKEDLYEGSWIIRKIIDAYPGEATREWVQVKLGRDAKAKQVSDFMSYQSRLGMANHFRRAATWAKLYGGAAIILYVDDGRKMDEPINRQAIRSVRMIDALDRYEIYPETTLSQDPFQPDSYRLVDTSSNPELKDLQAGGYLKIHPDRVIRFDGFELTRRIMRRNQNWGGSVIDNIWSSYSAWASVKASVCAMMHDFDLFIYMMQGLGNLMASSDDADLEILARRLRNLQVNKSNLKGLVLDKDAESATFASRNLSGLAELMNFFKEDLIGAADLPHTVVFGDAAGGLGSTGESEESTWVKLVGQYQENHLRERINKVFELIWLAKDGPTKGNIPDDWQFEFKPLFRRTQLEELTMKNQQATLDQTYMGLDVLTKDEVRQSRFAGAEFSYETVLDEEAWNKKKQQEEFDMSQFDMGAGVQPDIAEEGQEPAVDPTAVDPAVPEAVQG